MLKTYYVYILKCSDNTYYMGITSDLTVRLNSHKQGKYRGSYTFARRPVTLIDYAEFANPDLAIKAEKRLKKWSRAKKTALFNDDFEALKTLSKKQFKKK